MGHNESTPASVWQAVAGSEVTDAVLEWPPDLFALTIVVLARAEVFRDALSITDWPAARYADRARAVDEAGRRLAAWAEDRSGATADLVAAEWSAFRERANVPLEHLADGRRTTRPRDPTRDSIAPRRCHDHAPNKRASMVSSRRFPFSAPVLALSLIAVIVAACGGGGGATAAPAPPKTSSGRVVMVGLASTGLGRILVDSQGRTLYLFKLDSGSQSACTAPCAAAWPPLRVRGRPTVRRGANASLVATIQRRDGAQQLTYDAHPLYAFVEDQGPGDLSGQGVTAFWAPWFVPIAHPFTQLTRRKA